MQIKRELIYDHDAARITATITVSGRPSLGELEECLTVKVVSHGQEWEFSSSEALKQDENTLALWLEREVTRRLHPDIAVLDNGWLN